MIINLKFPFKTPPALIVTFAIVALAPKVTLFAPVVAIIASSPATGATPPTQVEPAAHAPPFAVLVLVKAFANEKTKNYIEENKSFFAFTLKIFSKRESVVKN